VYVTLFRPSPRPLHRWRTQLLKCFGAQIGKNCAIYPKCEIWAPWNLVCEDVVAIADGAIIYNPSLITLRSHSIVSQQAYLCGATHDYDDPQFPLISAPIILERYSWVCARATVHMGIRLNEGAILALGSIATKDLDEWGIYGGVPAKKIKIRKKPQNIQPSP
jgi:putative colanic acid biosynthesis acetyltransferase WcaF